MTGYIGRSVDAIDNISTLDNLSFNGSLQTFNLTQNSVAFTPVSADALQIQIDGIIQSGNYTVAGSTVTFDFTPSGSSVCNGIKHFGVGVLTTPSDGSVNMAQLGASGTKSSSTFLAGDNSFKSLTTNATHSGEVTGATALTIADNIVDEANLKVSNSPTNGYALTAQSGASGGMTWASVGGGKVLQVVSVTKSDTFTTTSTSLTDITGLTVAITPSATSSKILVLSSVNGSQDVAANRTYLKLFRDSTGIFVGDAAGGRLRGSGSFSSADATIADSTISATYLDSPSSTSAVTYKWQIVCAAGGNTGFINRTEHDANEAGQIRMASTITVMEIGA